MKKAVTLFWQGLKGILAGIANGLMAVFCLKDESLYGKVIRRIVGGCIACIMLMVLVVMGCDFWREMNYRFHLDRFYNKTYYNVMPLSKAVTYYSNPYDENRYVTNGKGKKTIKNIRWIASPLGNDSLVCYSNGEKRGFFNIHTGEVVIPPRYRHAWVFSEGLAAVDDKGWIKFIDQTGKVVIDPETPYSTGDEGYVFHDDRCVVKNKQRDRVGIMNRKGQWLLDPIYETIVRRDSLWIVNNGETQSVFNWDLQPVIPFTNSNIYIYDQAIHVTLPDHSLCKYDLGGNLIEDFYISDIERMTYDSPELRYDLPTEYDEEGKLVYGLSNEAPQFVQKTARCLRYEAETGHYGLMSPEGKVLTPPSYTSIKAIHNDLYLCSDGWEEGELRNSQGELVDTHASNRGR